MLAKWVSRQIGMDKKKHNTAKSWPFLDMPKIASTSLNNVDIDNGDVYIYIYIHIYIYICIYTYREREIPIYGGRLSCICFLSPSLHVCIYTYIHIRYNYICIIYIYIERERESSYRVDRIWKKHSKMGTCLNNYSVFYLLRNDFISRGTSLPAAEETFDLEEAGLGGDATKLANLVHSFA